MNTTKLKEALADLRAERNTIDSAIKSIELLIRSSNGTHGQQHDGDAASGTLIGLAVVALNNSGKPLNMKDLTYQVTKLKGKAVARNSLEASILRHRKLAGLDAKIDKVGPGIYALPEWPDSIKSN